MLLCALTVLPAAAVPSLSHAQQRPAAAQGPDALVALARTQYDDLRFEEAIQTLSAAVLRRGVTPQAELQLYELLALSYHSLNRSDEADGAWRLLLSRDPAHQPPRGVSPRTVSFFSEVRARWVAEESTRRANQPVGPGPASSLQAVSIEHRSPAEQRPTQPVNLTASLTDPGHRATRLIVAYRSGSRGLFRRIEARPNGSGALAAVIPGDAVRPPLVEYYLEAVDSAGLPVQSRGDALAPLRVAVPQPGLPWWPFVLGGGVLAAGAVAGIVYGVTAAGGQAPATLNITIVGN